MTPILELNKIIPVSGTEENEQLCKEKFEGDNEECS